MKTTKIMERPFYGSIIRQNHHTGYLSLKDLHELGNQVRRDRGLSSKNHADYFQTKETKEFLFFVAIEEGLSIDQLKDVKKGRNGETWLHPLVFLDIATWYNPQFKVKVLKWFYDNLLMFRDNSGDSFKSMNIALDKQFNMNSLKYIVVANRIANACGIYEREKRWEKATTEQLELRDKIQNNIALLADMSNDINVVIQKAIEKAKKT